MIQMIFRLLTPLVLFLVFKVEAASLATLYNRLDPTSISEHLTFYHLYKETKEGQMAHQVAASLLGCTLDEKNLINPNFTSNLALMLIAPQEEILTLSENQLVLIENLARHFANRKLLGFRAEKEAHIIAMDPQEIDIGRATLLTQLGESEEALLTIRSYEAMLDLMALQIQARQTKTSTPESLIEAINQLIFYEMGFRFPPHTLSTQQIDQYTFLSSVLSSRHGVCLGVSILFLAIAQRLDLPLTILTPPGHIFVRYSQGQEERNIETTARGIHVSSKNYLSLETREIPQRNLKEVVGFVHFNCAGTYLGHQEYAKALEAYKKAEPYLKHDPLFLELKGFTHGLVGEEELAWQELQKAEQIYGTCQDKQRLLEDILQKRLPLSSIKAFLQPSKEKRAEIVEQKKELEKIRESYPDARTPLYQLALLSLSLQNHSDAMDLILEYRRKAPLDPLGCMISVELSIDRLDYEGAKKELACLEILISDHPCKKELIRGIQRKLAVQ
jgi:tetratricopeptide (TPR) repeat protein